MNRKLSVMALDTPVRDQPVACVMGCRNTASDIMAPTATQLIRAPMPTTTQPYRRFMPIVVRGAAKATSAIQLVRPPDEGVDHGVGDLVEQRLEQPRQRAAGKLIAHRILGLAGVLACRREAPGGAELAKRPFGEAHVDGAVRLVLVLGGEALADAADPHGHRRLLAGAALLHARFQAPRQKARIGLDVVHERVHLGRRVLDDRRPGDRLHALKFFMSIVDNRKAFHDYFIEERYEAGIALAGWEVKAIRAGRAQIGDAYVMVRGAELYLIGAHISPLPTVSTHFVPDPTRTRKLLMHAEEIRRLIGKVEQRGYSLVPLN